MDGMDKNAMREYYKVGLLRWCYGERSRLMNTFRAPPAQGLKNKKVKGKYGKGAIRTVEGDGLGDIASDGI